MKIRLTILFFFCAITSSLFGQLQLGGGISSGTSDFYPFGVFGRVGYALGEKFSLAATAQTFFPKESTAGASSSLWQIHLDGQYRVLNNDWLSAYALAGIGYSSFRNEVNIPGVINGTFTANEIFFSVGAGVNYKVSEKIVPFGELRIPFLDGDARLLVNIGLMFRL